MNYNQSLRMSRAMDIAIAALALAWGGMVSAGNFVVNGGFETGTFADWTTERAAVGSFYAINGSTHHSGSFSAGFGAVANQDDRISQIVPTTSGQLYKLTFWVFNQAVGADHLIVLWEGNVILNQTPCAQPVNIWSKITLSVTATTNGSEVKFGLHDGPAGIFLDDISVAVPVPCPSDIAPRGGNNKVDVDDLLAVINGWGFCPLPCPPSCTSDITQNCKTDVDDLLAVINAWGLCP